MTFELNIKSLWQHAAKSTHLHITEIGRSEVSDSIVITVHSLRQLQPGNWKTPIKTRTEELTSLLSALQEFTKFPHFKNTHPLARHLVENSFLSVSFQALTTRQQAQNGTKQNKTKQNKLQLN